MPYVKAARPYVKAKPDVSAIPPALTLWRPWPELILNFGKNVENRGWPTSYRGPLLIHAGKRYDHSALHNVDRRFTALGPAAPAGIVGIVDLTGICGKSWPLAVVQCECGPWAMPDQWHWQLSNPRPFHQPINCSGRQGLWHPVGEVAQLVADQLRLVGAL